MAVAKLTLTGATEYQEKRLYTPCSALIVRCADSNIPADAKIEVTYNDGAGSKKIIPNIKMHDLSEIRSQRRPIGHFLYNELIFDICDHGNLMLGNGKHITINISGLQADRTYTVTPYAKGEGRVSAIPIIYSYNTVSVGDNKCLLPIKPNTIVAIPDTDKIIEVTHTFSSGAQEIMNREMLQVDQREDNGMIAKDVIAPVPVEHHGFINWFSFSLFQFKSVEIELDQTGFEYILVEGLNLQS